MLHVFMEKGPWFRARRFGYGAGLPFKWQGWAVVGLYLLALVGIFQLPSAADGGVSTQAITLFLITTAIFVAVCRKRTEGGWKWRTGGAS